MPKKISEEYQKNIRDMMYQKGVALIKQKGIRKVTVDDVTQSMGMSKGLFYRYYDSREIYLYNVMKRNEKECFEKMMQTKISQSDMRQQLLSMFDAIVMSDESLFFFIEPTDLEYLLTRLPDEIRKAEQEKSQSNFLQTADLFEMNNTPENYQTLSYLMDGLQFVARDSAKYGGKQREKALRIFVNAVIDFIMEARNE